MSQQKQLSILEFSRLTGIKRDNLRFYDRIGLLKPETRGENGYRFYSRRQLGSAYLISGLRQLGVGLEDIKAYSAKRTPEDMLALFAQQERRIEAELAKLRETGEILRRYGDLAREALCHSEGDFVVEERGRERIFLCPPVSAAVSEEDGELLAFEYAGSHAINLGSPTGVLVSCEALREGAACPEYRYYFKAGRRGNAWKPAGMYAVAYDRYDAQTTRTYYQGFLERIRARGLEAYGGIYGEFLLNELAVQDPGQYFGRVEVQVTRAAADGP